MGFSESKKWCATDFIDELRLIRNANLQLQQTNINTVTSDGPNASEIEFDAFYMFQPSADMAVKGSTSAVEVEATNYLADGSNCSTVLF